MIVKAKECESESGARQFRNKNKDLQEFTISSEWLGVWPVDVSNSNSCSASRRDYRGGCRK
jgi:hypothetical protein